MHKRFMMSLFSRSSRLQTSLLNQAAVKATARQFNSVSAAGQMNFFGVAVYTTKFTSWAANRLVKCDGLLSLRNAILLPQSSQVGAITIATNTSMICNLQSLLRDLSTWFIKRTFQPSIVRKRRKHGFLRRQESVGGRRVLKRRAAKGRIRLGGS